MNYKDFDLEAAKNGAAVITTLGFNVDLLKFDVENNIFTIIGSLINWDGTEECCSWSYCGSSSRNDIDGSDLRMAPVIKECWINFYSVAREANAYPSIELANHNAVDGRTSCIYHTWEE